MKTLSKFKFQQQKLFDTDLYFYYLKSETGELTFGSTRNLKDFKSLNFEGYFGDDEFYPIFSTVKKSTKIKNWFTSMYFKYCIPVMTYFNI